MRFLAIILATIGFLLMIIGVIMKESNGDTHINNLTRESYTITNIEYFDAVMCKYKLQTEDQYDLTIKDSIGKFNVGDTIIFNMTKK